VLHVVAGLIAVSLVSRQLVLLSALQNFFFPYVVRNVYSAALLKNSTSIDVNFFLNSFL